jgi:hypothetical protein
LSCLKTGVGADDAATAFRSISYLRIGAKTVVMPLKWDVCFTPEKKASISYAADCDVIVCGGATIYSKHLASKVHCVDDEIIGWLKRREQASFNCFGESAKITAVLRRGPVRYVVRSRALEYVVSRTRK